MEQLCNYEEENFRDATIDMVKYCDWYTASGEARAGVPDLGPDY